MKNLGEILLSQRKKMRQTPDSLYKNLKIHPKYIKALEENDYSVFDSSLHARGFLKIYAGALGLNVEEVLAIWRREFGYIFREDFPDKNMGISKGIKSGFVITLNRVFFGLAIVLLLSFFGYLYVAYKNYQGPPELLISHPEDNMVLSQPLVDITGKTDIDATLLINGEVLLVKPDGNFATSVSLKEGVNTISVTSINSLEKRTERILTVIYRPDKASIAPEEKPEGENEPLEEDIDIKDNADFYVVPDL